MNSFDSYTRRARHYPALLAAVPAIALLIAGAVEPTAAASPLAIVLGAVGIVVASVVRDLGRRLQPALWEAWGGSPTLRRLRWRDPADRASLERLHNRLQPMLTAPLPTEEEEAADPTDADRRYEDAIAELRELTRGNVLVFEENVNYGFRRNCLGIRPVAITIAATCYLVSLAIAIATGELRFLVATAVALVCAATWWRFVTPDWVRRAAEIYADQLLRATRPDTP